MPAPVYMSHTAPGEQSPKKQSKKPNRSGTARRLRLLLFAFACFLVWASLTFWDLHTVAQEKLAELSVKEEQLSEVQSDHDAYQHEIERLHAPEYIEQRLRKDYMMSRDGEILFIRTN